MRTHNSSYARSEYDTQLANMSFDEIFDLTAGVYFHFLHYYNVIMLCVIGWKGLPPRMLHFPDVPTAVVDHSDSARRGSYYHKMFGQPHGFLFVTSFTLSAMCETLGYDHDRGIGPMNSVQSF